MRCVKKSNLSARTEEMAINIRQSDDGSTHPMMLDMLAIAAPKAYTDRKRCQAQKTAKSKTEGGCRDQKEDIRRNAAIMGMLYCRN